MLTLIKAPSNVAFTHIVAACIYSMIAKCRVLGRIKWAFAWTALFLFIAAASCTLRAITHACVSGQDTTGTVARYLNDSVEPPPGGVSF